MRGFYTGNRLWSPRFAQRAAKPFGQTRGPESGPCLGAISGDFAKHGVGQTFQVTQLLVRRDQFDHRVDHAMCSAALSQLYSAHPQHVAHGQGGVL